MKYLKIVLFSLFMIPAGFGISCPYNLTLSTQAEIDQFQSNYPGCTTINGSLNISGTDITNLDGLSVLVSIEYDLDIESNSVLMNISGLSNIKKIGGRL